MAYDSEKHDLEGLEREQQQTARASPQSTSSSPSQGPARQAQAPETAQSPIEITNDNSLQQHPRTATATSTANTENSDVDAVHNETTPTAATTIVAPPLPRQLDLVPRHERRGLFGRLTLVPEATNPQDYGPGTKWAITFIVAIAASVGPMGSSIFYPALKQMAIDLHASGTVTNLAVAMYMLAMAVFPLWWSSFSEAFGRRTVYLSSFALFVVFSVLSALSSSVGMLIAMRILAGGASASVQAVGAGTIADIWEPRERGKAMGIFYLGPLMGPFLAPILGGALSQAFGWQATMWFLAIYGGFILVAVLFLLPETLSRSRTHPEPDPSPTNNNKNKNNLLHRLLIDPLSVLLVLRIPAVAVVVANAAITFGSLFALNISIQSAFSSPTHYYNFDELAVGLLYLGPSLGYVLAAIVGGRWTDHIMAREARKRAARQGGGGGKKGGSVGDDGDKGNGDSEKGGNDGEEKGGGGGQGTVALVYLPEDRMRENAWVAAVAYPAALVFYGWTVQKGLFWFVPEIGLFVFGMASMVIFSASTTMLTEFVPRRNTAGVAVNNFVRNILSCVGAVAAQPLIDAIGHGWMFTALGLFTAIVGCLCIWAMQRFGPRWRKRMAVDL